jgi:acetyl esterase/lipase
MNHATFARLHDALLTGRRWLEGVPLEAMNRAAAHRAVLRDLEYGSHERQTLDLYLHPVSSAMRATVLFVHGGYWDSGDKRLYPFMADAILSMGFNAALLNYRLAPAHRFPDYVVDAALALRFLRETLLAHGQRSDALLVLGHSAGAHTTALVCCTPTYLEAVGGSRDWIAGAVGMAGPYDFLDWIPGDARMQRAFGPPETWNETQPVLVADGLNPPMLLLHGSKDDVATPMHAPALRDAIVKRGGRAEYRWYPRLNHYTMVGTFSKLLRWLEPDAFKDVQRFFEACLGERAARG